MPRLRVGETLHSDTGTPYLVDRAARPRAASARRTSDSGCPRGPRRRDRSRSRCAGASRTGTARPTSAGCCRATRGWWSCSTRSSPRPDAASGSAAGTCWCSSTWSEGTVWDAIEGDGLRWSEGKVRAEIRALLKVLRRMHGVWIIHRDIKPDNVYLRDGRLVLGDFGITKLALDQKGADASQFQPDFAPRDLASSAMWGPAEDIFQVGLLAATPAVRRDLVERRGLRARDRRAGRRATRSRAGSGTRPVPGPSATGTPTTPSTRCPRCAGSTSRRAGRRARCATSRWCSPAGSTA